MGKDKRNSRIVEGKVTEPGGVCEVENDEDFGEAGDNG